MLVYVIKYLPSIAWGKPLFKSTIVGELKHLSSLQKKKLIKDRVISGERKRERFMYQRSQAGFSATVLLKCESRSLIVT